MNTLSKRLKAGIALVLLAAFIYGTVPLNAYANEQDDVENDRTIVSDFEVEDDFTVKTADGDTVDLSLAPDTVDAIDNEAIEVLVCINPEAEEIQVATEESLSDMEEIPEQVAVVTDDDTIVNVVLDGNAEEGDVTAEDVIDIIENNEFSDYDTLTIYDVNGIDYQDDCFVKEIVTEQSGQDSTDITPQGTFLGENVTTVKTTRKFADEKAVKKSFIISVAKGMTETLTKKFSASIKLTLKSGAPFSKSEATAGFASTVSYTATTSKIFVGPPETSKYNSRAFYVNFYAKDCTVTQTVTNNMTGTTKKYVSQYSVPTRYAAFNIDSYEK